MARIAAGGFWSQVRAGVRAVCLCLVAAVLLLSPGIAQAQAVKGEASFSASGGYARLLFKLAEDVPVEVTTAGSIVIIRFERPVDIPMDRWVEGALDYVSSARRDPDGSAIRLSLARRVKINTMAAGERTFIDFLPDSWSGPPPSLPIEVVRELAERARAAEKALRLQRAEAIAKKRPPVRVRALLQPTFVRFVFEMPDGVGASSVLNDGKLSLQFGGLLTFDLADAKIAAPPNIASINQKVEGDSTQVEIALIGDVDVHSFREEKNYIVDVGFQSDKPRESPLAESAKAAAPRASEKPAREGAEHHSEEIKPPTSETIAKQMKAEAKPEVAAPAVKEAAKEPPSEGAREAAPAETIKPAEMAKPVAVEAKPAALEEQKEAKAPVVEQSKAPAAETKPAGVVEAPAMEVHKLAAEAAKPDAEAVKPAEAPKLPAVEAPKKMAAAPPPDANPANASAVGVWRDSDGLRLTFSFAQPTPAASFRRGDTVWLIFDSTNPFDVEQIRAKGGAIIGDVIRQPLDKGQAIRIRLNRPQMNSLTSDARSSGTKWTLILADTVEAPPQPLSVMRNITDPALANLAVPLASPGLAHRFVDPDAGDTLVVVTALPPVRGLIKRQDFVDFALLDSAHGVAIRPNSDDVGVEVAPGKVIIGKPGGLTLSSASISAERAPMAVRPLFDIEEWHKNQKERFLKRQSDLIVAAANAAPEKRFDARLALARFYMAQGFYPEAKGESEFLLADPGPKSDEPVAVMVHAVASVLCDRPDLALKDLASPAIGNNYDSQLWKAVAFARHGKWVDAREKFKNAEFSIASLPLELQRIVTMDAMLASLEVKDYAGAAKRRAELDVIGVPAEIAPAVALLRGRLAEALGNERDALDDYRLAAGSADRKSAAEAKQREVALRQKRNEITPPEAQKELETLAAIWRGDSTEVKTLQMLSLIYIENGRYADSLGAARTATRLEPNSESSRQAQDTASALFSQVFLTPKGDDLPPIDALGMFFEYRELTPIGRRGDEMIRRLAERLVAVDLLDQAAELLQYQVDKRLEGSARAQVAARLAMVYLANHKPSMALTALRATRIADLAGELRQQRLLIEARANSDIGRHDLALDIVSNLSGREAIRLRSDIYWAARRWRESSEQIELYYGDRWRDFKPLNPAEKSDVIRAVIGYTLADDALGLQRFREKYAPLMSGENDKLAFDTASKPAAASAGEFAAIAKMAASVDTLDGFIREMKTRFPDATARAPLADPNPTGSLPKIDGERSIRG